MAYIQIDSQILLGLCQKQMLVDETFYNLKEENFLKNWLTNKLEIINASWFRRLFKSQRVKFPEWPLTLESVSNFLSCYMDPLRTIGLHMQYDKITEFRMNRFKKLENLIKLCKLSKTVSIDLDNMDLFTIPLPDLNKESPYR